MARTAKQDKVAKPKRSYSPKTLKMLFALSGNRCAAPSCSEPIIAGKTSQSEAMVVGQIAHIYQFKFAIDRMGSDGVDQMVVFCFDLVVATLRARRGGNLRWLVHDSSMFADVDQRQYGLALQLAARVSDAEGFQYICCLNVGALPRDHLGDLDLDAFIRLRLSDDSDEGRLLGKRLKPRDS